MSSTAQEQIKATIEKFNGEAPNKTYKPTEGLLSLEAIQKNVLEDMKTTVTELDALRRGGNERRCIDIDFNSYVKTKFGFSSLASLMHALSIDPSVRSIEELMTMPDMGTNGFRWLVPEIFRSAILLGMRRAPLYTSLIAGEESVSQRKITMPYINMSDATPEYLNEGETIPVGSTSFQERDVKIQKLGTGLKISDEVQKYVSLNILSLYLQDVGVKMGLGLDTLAIDSLINGDDSAATFSAPVVGVSNPALGVQYIDLLRSWIRMGRLGKMPNGLISNEDEALVILQMAEFKGANYNNTKQNINLKTPIPQSAEYLIHGAMPSGNKIAMYDAKSALIKLNATGLLVESARIAERQLTGTYVTQTTGFARMFRDAFLIIDGTLDIATNPFPSYMNPNAAENVIFE